MSTSSPRIVRTVIVRGLLLSLLHFPLVAVVVGVERLLLLQPRRMGRFSRRRRRLYLRVLVLVEGLGRRNNHGQLLVAGRTVRRRTRRLVVVHAVDNRVVGRVHLAGRARVIGRRRRGWLGHEGRRVSPRNHLVAVAAVVGVHAENAVRRRCPLALVLLDVVVSHVLHPEMAKKMTKT